MGGSDMYLKDIIKKYERRDLKCYISSISELKETLKTWAGIYYVNIIKSGSIAKGTAISIASDVDLMVSLTSNCNENNGGLESIYDSLYSELNRKYQNVRKQNVSVRINLPSDMGVLNKLEVDITPARKQAGNTNDHSLWVSKLKTWCKTNIQKHIDDILNSNRINEIKLLKIWRELNELDFPSIYLEYLLIKNILSSKSFGSDYWEKNFLHILSELAKPDKNPLLLKIRDPANLNNILSDLLTTNEKAKIALAAETAIDKTKLSDIIY